MSAPTQLTLPDTDRWGCNTASTTRIFLSCAQDQPELKRQIGGFLTDHVIDGSLSDRWEIAWPAATDIMAEGSGVIKDSNHPDIDQQAWIYGTQRSDTMRDAVALANSDAIDPIQIVVLNTLSLGSTVRDIRDSLDTLLQAGAKITIAHNRERFDLVDNGISLLSAIDKAGIDMQREATKDDIRQWSGVDKTEGRAGLGFQWIEVDGGTEWVPADDYDRVCSILEMVRDGELSKNKAAAELDTSPRTITRCIEERSGRYGL